MKKRILALGLAITMAMPMTAMAAQKTYQPGEQFTTQDAQGGTVARQVNIVTIDDLIGTDRYTTEQFITCVKTAVARQFPDCDIYAMHSPKGDMGALWVDGYQLKGKSITAEQLGFISVFPDGTMGDPSAYTGEGLALGTLERCAVTTAAGRTENCFLYFSQSGNDQYALYILPKAANDIHVAFCDADPNSSWISFGIRFHNDMPNTGGAVYLKGGASQTASASSQTWVSDASGWRVQRSDGSYLVNEWYQSNGLWYYMGADGYMLTNTTTPDGYPVNADGVRVE